MPIGLKEVLQSFRYMDVAKACREIKFKEEYDNISNDKTLEEKELKELNNEKT